MQQQPVERFDPTSGRVTAVLVLVLAGVVVVAGTVDAGSVPLPVLAGAVLAAVLAWASMLRPALWATTEHLVMRNMLETVHVPLAAIEQLAVRQVLALKAGEKRYVSTVVGRPLRKAMRTGRSGRSGSAPVEDAAPAPGLPYADFVEQRLHQLMEEARTAAGVESLSDEQLALAADVRREPAWVPIGLTVLSAVAFVASLFV
ncbi:hypothetical protein [Nocardioides terrigena]|uniref:hypothetical protein n=1 Tax=Nocardioides terrigena TaxID=424797 RepID=UPI000D30D776|nr:hypothetical protein [Nocardioides terrigena]